MRISQARENRLARNGGGKRITAPATSEIRLAKSLIDKEFSADKFDVPDREEAAFTIASDARALMRANPALGLATAINQAFLASRGDFGVTTKSWGKDTVAFSSQGRTPQTALPLPKNPQDRSGYTEGRFYRGKTGPGLYIGGGKFLTGTDAVRWLSDNNGRTDDTSDDEDEE